MPPRGKLDFSRRELGVGDPRRLFTDIPKGELPYEEVDFSMTNLSGSGFGAVIEICKRCPELRVLKLFKNRLDDAAADLLCDLFRKVTGIHEIHLSHNLLTAVGAKKIIAAGEETRRPSAAPLWLRLEHNQIADAEGLLEELKQTASVCERVDERSCTVRMCCRGCKVHVPYFNLQRCVSAQPGHAATPVQPTAGQGAAPFRSGYQPPSLPKPRPAEVSGPKGAGKADGKGKHTEPKLAWGKTDVDTSSKANVVAAAPAVAAAAPIGVKVADTPQVRTTEESMWPEQLMDRDSANELICGLCKCVLRSPSITRCSHLFCSSCFSGWVADKVAEHKQGPNGRSTMPGLPCPTCNQILKRQDFIPLAEAKGPAAVLLARRWRNIQLRCKHHRDLFSCSFGSKAQWICQEADISCNWSGDLPMYENHLRDCPVERELAFRLGKTATPKGAAIAGTGPGGEPFAEPEPANAAATAAAAPAPDAADAGAEETGSPESEEENEIRIVKHTFDNNGDPTRLCISKNDMVKIFDVTDSGWAAGVRVDPDSLAEIGNPGWFPVEYLNNRDT